MTTVTSLTADRMLAIEAASVVDGDVIGGNLILTKHDGSQINAGSVTGPTGPQGPQGALLPVITGVPVSDVGLANQIRAGRQLTAADFTNIGLSAPAGLWNLSDLSDVSGNGRNLLNKGAVPFAAGINGVATTAAQFVGSTAQAFYIPDTGVNDPFRIKTGSWGCWFRTAKRGTTQGLLCKRGANLGWELDVTASGSSTIVGAWGSLDGTAVTASIVGVSDVGDDRWHFAVVIHDGTTLRLYVDGILEGSSTLAGTLFASSGPLDIGAEGGDGSNAAGSPHFGRIDEAFITADVLSDDQVRNLYCAKILHTLAAVPSRVSLNVKRRRKGAALAAADFPTQPLRLYNFSGGSLGDEGSNGVGLINNGAAVNVAGVDGSSGNAFSFNGGGQSLSSTDAGMPSGLTARSYGGWFKTSYLIAAGMIIKNWGTNGSADSRWGISGTQGTIFSGNGSDVITGSFVCDGQWHHAVVVEDNAAADGIKRKLYVDGKLNGVSITLNPITLIGAGGFRIGCSTVATTWFTGQIDGVFVCDYALTTAQILTLYAKGSQALASSPKNPGVHIEAMSSANLLAVFDTLESQHTIDLGVEP